MPVILPYSAERRYHFSVTLSTAVVAVYADRRRIIIIIIIIIAFIAANVYVIIIVYISD